MAWLDAKKLSTGTWVAIFAVGIYFGAASHIQIHGKPTVFTDGTEAEVFEEQFVPILERLEADLEKIEGLLEGPSTAVSKVNIGVLRRKIELNKQRLKDVGPTGRGDVLPLFTEAGIEELTAENGGEARIHILLNQLHANASPGRILFRICIFGFFVIFPSSAHLILFEMALPFMPAGHEITTAGRHDDGGRTWFGLRRMEFIFFVITHFALLNIFHRHVKSGKFQKMFFRPMRLLLSAAKACVFLYLAKVTHDTAPASLFECEETSSVEVAESLWRFYIAICISDVATTLLAVLCGTLPAGALIRHPPSYWFWYLIVYYCPVGDMW
jgi:hypothetical protein